MMNKYLFLLSFCSIFSSVTAKGPVHSVKDSIRLDEVIVTGSRTEVNQKYLPMTVSVIGSDKISAAYRSSVIPLLSEEVPGFFVTERGVMGYGVANGAAGGISIRGVGGSPNTQILVLIDGHPQYMGIMGHPLPDAYESQMMQRIEVVRGPASILYGSNAMAGVINIITKKQLTDGFKNHARLMYGSYNSFSAEAGSAYRNGRFNSYVSMGYNKTDGERLNSDFNQYSGYTKLGYDLSSHWNLFADLNLTHYNAANPGIISNPIIDNDAKVLRGMTSFSLENKYANSSGAFRVYYNWGNHKINDGYYIGESPKDYLYHSNDNMLGVSLYQSYSFLTGNTVTGGLDYVRLGGRAWNEFATKNVDIVNKHINRGAGYLNISQVLADKLTFNAGVRADYDEKNGVEWIPQGGISYIANESTILKVIASKGFRNPTIREMYMFPPQNADLKPERLMNYEFSADKSFMDNALHLNFNLYYINGKNLIQTVMSNGKPLNVNIGKVNNYGAELASVLKLSHKLSLMANLSWLHMKYPVQAAPEYQLYVSAKYTRSNWGASTGMQVVNNLYTSIGATPLKENYALWNIRTFYRPSKIWEFFVKGENLLNQTYQINAGFPMPGATFFGGISLDI